MDENQSLHRKLNDIKRENDANINELLLENEKLSQTLKKIEGAQLEK